MTSRLQVSLRDYPDNEHVKARFGRAREAAVGNYHSCMKTLSDRRIAALFSLVLASGLCVALLAVRVRYPHGSDFEFLTWNLFLAWVPFVLAVVLHDAARRGQGMAFLGAVGFVWLLFLPNAPYIVTDFVHVGRVSGVPVWYDAAMIASFAGVGLVLGLVSILLVQGWSGGGSVRLSAG